MTTNIDLVEPSLQLRDSYRGLVEEFLARSEKLVPFPLQFPTSDFPVFLERLAACARGEELPDGFVPHSTFWLVRNGTEVLGVSNLRHRLTDALRAEGGHIGYGIRPSARGQGFATQLLRRTLDRAWAIGIEEAWLTCGKGNLASVRTILHNGGVLVSEEFMASRGEVIQRYKIFSPQQPEPET